MARGAPVPLSLTDWVVLGLLAEGPSHGFALARELAADGDLGRCWRVRRPLVYRAIDHLVAVGLAEPRTVEPGDQGPHRRVVAATRRGRARLRRWLDEPVVHRRDVRSTLLVKLALRARRGLPLAPLARRQLTAFGPVPAADRGEPGRPGHELARRWRLEADDAIRRFLEGLLRDDAGRVDR